MLLSGKYAYFETFKTGIQNIFATSTFKDKKKYNDYIKKLMINIGHMESATALNTYRQIPNAKMQVVYKIKDENNIQDRNLRDQLHIDLQNSKKAKERDNRINHKKIM